MTKLIGTGIHNGNKVKLTMEYSHHGSNTDFNLYFNWETTELYDHMSEYGEIKSMSWEEAQLAGLEDKTLYDFIQKYNRFGSLGTGFIGNIRYYASKTTTEKRLVWDKLIIKGIGTNAPVKLKYGEFESRPDILEIDFNNPPKLVKVVEEDRYVGYTYEGSLHNETWHECPWDSPAQYRMFCRIGRKFGYTLVPKKRIPYQEPNESYSLESVCRELILPMDTVLANLSRIKDEGDSFVSDRLEDIGRNHILPFVKENFYAETFNHAIIIATKNYKGNSDVNQKTNK